MLILSLDTALGGMSVSLQRDGREIAGYADPAQGDQAARLLPTIEQVMVEGGVGYSELTGLGVTIGPGGFTGVRIGLAAARALAFAAKKPLFGMTTLSLIAEACPVRPLIAALPAGRGAFYVQTFSSGRHPEQREGFPSNGTPITHEGELSLSLKMTAVLEPQLLLEAETFALAAGCALSCPSGEWLERLPPDIRLIPHDIAANARLAGLVALRRGFADLSEALPLYIRPPDAKPQPALVG